MTPLAEALREGQSLPAYLDQLEARFAKREGEVLAFLPEEGRFDRLRREAGKLLSRFPEPATRPPLFGVPVAVKDVFRAAGFSTRAGSRLPPELFEGPEASCVMALKTAGALILGKSVSTELAYFGAGPTRNPHDLERTPGGSSSGSAAAVGACLAPLALGTQTIGSIGRPAAFCGVVGFKPSYGRVPSDGLVPLAPSLDHVGLFTRDAAGAALAARVLLAGFQEEAAGKGAAKPVLGVPAGPYLEKASEEALASFEVTRRRLEAVGYRIVEAPAFKDFSAIEARHRLIVAAEAARVHAAWYPRYADLYHPKTRELVERGRVISDQALAEALLGLERLRRDLDGRMNGHGIEAWISPAAPGAAPRGLDSTGDPVMNLPWTHAGVPTLVLPVGRDPEGMPLGLQVAGRFGADEALLALGIGLEAALGEGE